MESDLRYYSRRAAEERLRATRSLTQEARQRHSDLASLFAVRAEGRLHNEEHAHG
jgi:hypothetical protein